MPDEGFKQAMKYSLFEAICHRRSRRISKGLRPIRAGSLTYPPPAQTPPSPPSTSQPLSALEEALLISVTGATGMIMPDRPFQDDKGEPILGSPYLTMTGRSAGSPDNAQGTHFFMINDSGTYFLKQLPPAPPPATPQQLIDRAEQCKVKVLETRPMADPNLRQFPYYLDSNRFISNVAGSTIFFPVVDMTRQYINGLMYLLTEAAGTRPNIIDDRNFYLKAGIGKWVRNGFLNSDIKLPLGVMGAFRTQIEPDLLLQNLMLALQAMGLGGWIHATPSPAHLLGHPMYQLPSGSLKFTFAVPRFGLFDLLRWGVFLPKVRAHPVGLRTADGELIRCLCPPNYSNVSDAVDELIQSKYGSRGVYENSETMRQIFNGNLGDAYRKEVPRFSDQVIACTKDICNYIYRTHGRFPAHVDAIHVPGIWLQAHHLDLEYYDYLFKGGYTQTQRDHEAQWH